MENQKKQLKPFIINYGLILGVASILFHGILYVLGKHQEKSYINSIIGIAIVIGVLYFAINKFKEYNNGLLSIGQSVKLGLGVALISGILVAIYTYIFMSYVEPDSMKLALEKAEEAMFEQNPELTDEQVEMSLGMMKKFMTPGGISTMFIFVRLLTGLLISLILGLAMKKEEELY